VLSFQSTCFRTASRRSRRPGSRSTFDQQLALDAYWQLIGSDKFLPGTISAADRFARLSYNLKASPKFKDPELAVASAFSQLRAMSVPLGMNDPEHPNISSTLWRTVADENEKRYFFSRGRSLWSLQEGRALRVAQESLSGRWFPIRQSGSSQRIGNLFNEGMTDVADPLESPNGKSWSDLQ
jgi:Linear amide C-N hydrolases, choloylglycine hydrolase family